MNTSKHVSDIELIEYLKSPQQTRFESVRLHLATCPDCRRLCELTTLLRQQGHLLNSVDAEYRSDIASLIHGSPSTRQAEELRHQIKQDPATLKAALHYTSHHIAMQNQTRTESAIEEVVRPTAPIRLRDIFKRWIQIETPIWKLAPVAAIFVVVVSLFSVQQGDHELLKNGVIVSYQDNPVIQFVAQEPQPGIGFFSDAGKFSKPYGKMAIGILSNQSIRFNWKAVDDALAYRLKLQVFRDGEMVVLGQLSSTKSNAVLPLKQPLTSNRHEWVLSGNTTDGRAFQTSGGFVINRLQDE